MRVASRRVLVRSGHRGFACGMANAAMEREVLESVDVRREHLFGGVLAGHERLAAIACCPPGVRAIEVMPDGLGKLRPRDDTIRIDQRYDGYTVDPGLQVHVREPFDIGSI